LVALLAMIYNPCEGQPLSMSPAAGLLDQPLPTMPDGVNPRRDEAYSEIEDQEFGANSMLSAKLAESYGLNESQNALAAKWGRNKDKKKYFDIKCLNLPQEKLEGLFDEYHIHGYSKRVWCCKHHLGCANPNYTSQQICEQAKPKGATAPACTWHPEGRKSPANFKSHQCTYDNQAYLDNFQCDHLCDDSLDPTKMKKSHLKLCCRVQKKEKFCKSLIPKSVGKKRDPKDKYMSKPLDEIQFNCSDKMQDPTKWLAIKRRWCYSHWGVGVLPKNDITTFTTTVTTSTATSTFTTTTTTPGVHDCYTGVKDWVETFPYVKKVYCCKFWDRRDNFPAKTRQKCCDYLGFGCQTTIQTTSKPYDCHAGYFNWIKGWSPNKKVYCCRTEGRGCIFDCSADYHHGDWRQEWSMAKKAWCCLTEGRGCADDAQQVHLV